MNFINSYIFIFVRLHISFMYSGMSLFDIFMSNLNTITVLHSQTQNIRFESHAN